MHLICFSVHDSKAEAFIQPFFLPNVPMALRIFEGACNDPQSNFKKYPGDFTLFEIGIFDCDKGTLIPHENAVNHGLAISFQKTRTDENLQLVATE